MPEGLDDCVIETKGNILFLQIKSREQGNFGHAEVEAFIKKIRSKFEQLGAAKNSIGALCLERPHGDAPARQISELSFSDVDEVYISAYPGDDIISTINHELECHSSVAEIIANSLYRWVADTASANAGVAYADRRRLTTEETENKIRTILASAETARINDALRAGILKPLDFETELCDTRYYQGVKAKLGHAASGLILPRPLDSDRVLDALETSSAVLIEGPSGAGKSSLLWLVASEKRQNYRWLEISASATSLDAGMILDFIIGRQPKADSPIALVMDDVSEHGTSLWNSIAEELLGVPHVTLLGTVRVEDRALIRQQSESAFVPITLQEELAEQFWAELKNRNQTDWLHWREPFEKSKGLMLEYTHLLTKGQRLSKVIADQISQREQSGRHDELAIIRATAVINMFGGEIEAARLFSELKLSKPAANLAMKRLLDEHLIRESRPGIVSGMHGLRSQALAEASHDEVTFVSEDSFWIGFAAVTSESVTKLVHLKLSKESDAAQLDFGLKRLAGHLEQSQDVSLWAGILNGLGIASLERHVDKIIPLLEANKVPKGDWFLASLFISSNTALPALGNTEHIELLRAAIKQAQSLTFNDLRSECLSFLSNDHGLPQSADLQSASKLIASMASISDNDPINIDFIPEFSEDTVYDIDDVASLLSAAYSVSKPLAMTIAKAFGGEEKLLSLFVEQKPWIKQPEFFDDDEAGKGIRADKFAIDLGDHTSMHEAVVAICDILFAICPSAEIAASDAVYPNGQVIELNGFNPASKMIPRENSPSKATIAWNRQFFKLLMGRANAPSLTTYVTRVSELLVRAEKAFRLYTERWINGKSPLANEAHLNEIKEISAEGTDLAFSASKPSAAKLGATSEPIMVGTLISNMLNSLIVDLSKVGQEGATKASACHAGELSSKFEEIAEDDFWRMVDKHPKPVLKALSKRLFEISQILHELHADPSEDILGSILKATKSATMNKRVSAAARLCRNRADARLSDTTTRLVSLLAEKSWSAMCVLRELKERDSVYWPPYELAVLVDIDDFESQASYLDDGFEVARDQIKQDYRYTIVPVTNGQVIGQLALRETMNLILPVDGFEDEWRSSLELPLSNPYLSEPFQTAVTFASIVSAIALCKEVDQSLLEVEANLFSEAFEGFEKNRSFLADQIDLLDSDVVVEAVDYLESLEERINDELQATKNGNVPDNPICMEGLEYLSGEQSDSPNVRGILIMLLKHFEAKHPGQKQ